MAHFAEVNDQNIVVRVLVVPDEQEHRGNEFLAKDLGLGGRWIQTSYNSRFRKHFAGIGFTYDEQHDVFIRPQPYSSWTLDTNCDWQAPVPKPSDANWSTYWDEGTLSWVTPFTETNDLPT